MATESQLVARALNEMRANPAPIVAEAATPGQHWPLRDEETIRFVTRAVEKWATFQCPGERTPTRLSEIRRLQNPAVKYARLVMNRVNDDKPLPAGPTAIQRKQGLTEQHTAELNALVLEHLALALTRHALDAVTLLSRIAPNELERVAPLVHTDARGALDELLGE